jgi:hypothetical protein
MSPTEYMQALAALGIPNHAQAARLLRINDRTSRKWATGQRAIPETAASLLILARYLMRAGMTLEEIMRVIQSKRGGDDSRFCR